MQQELREIASIDAHVGVAWAIAWSPGTQGLLASCGADRCVIVWHNCSTVQEQWMPLTKCAGSSFPRTIRSLYWGPTLDKIVVGSFDGLVTILKFNVQSDSKEAGLTPQASLEGHESEVKCVAFSASGSLLASCARDKTVWLWEDTMGDGDYECAGLLAGHAADVKHVVWHPARDDVFVSCSYDDTIRVWQEDMDLEEYVTVASLTGHGSTVWAVAFNSEGTCFASVSADQSLIVWKNISTALVQGQCSRWSALCTLPKIHNRPVYTVDWSPHAGEQHIATAGGDNTVCIFGQRLGDGPEPAMDGEKYHLIAKAHQAHAGDVNCVRWDPMTPGRLATCGDDGKIRIFQLEE